MASLVCLSNKTQFVKTVCAIVLKGHWDNLLKPKIGSSLTSTTINQVLLHLSPYGFFLSWSFFKWVETIPSYSHSLQSSWTMIHILTKQKQFKTAQNMLEKIAPKNFLSSPSVLNALVGTQVDPDLNSQVFSWLVIIYANSKMIQDAIQVFEHMMVSGIMPQLHACTVLLNSLVKDRLIDTVWKIYKKMIKIGVIPNIHIFNVLIHACCKSSEVEKAEQLLAEMELKGKDGEKWKKKEVRPGLWLNSKAINSLIVVRKKFYFSISLNKFELLMLFLLGIFKTMGKRCWNQYRLNADNNGEFHSSSPHLLSPAEAGQQMKAKAQGAADAAKNAPGMNK